MCGEVGGVFEGEKEDYESVCFLFKVTHFVVLQTHNKTKQNKQNKTKQNRFVQQKEESKKLLEKMNSVSSEIQIQEQLLEVVERNACLSEKRAHQVRDRKEGEKGEDLLFFTDYSLVFDDNEITGRD